MMSAKLYLVILALASTSSYGQSSKSAEVLAKDSYQIVILAEVAKHANTQQACINTKKVSEINPKEILEIDVKPLLIHYASKQGKSTKSIDLIIEKLLQAPSAKIENTSVAIHTYNTLRERISESNADYCATLHQFINHLIDRHVSSIKEIKNRAD
jgi:hypothetical protein